MGILAQSALIVAVTAFSLAITSLTRNFRNKLVQSYAFVCVVICGWGGFFFLERMYRTGTFYKVHLAFNLMLAPVGIYFIRELTGINTVFIRTLYSATVGYTVIAAILPWTQYSKIPIIKTIMNFGPGTLAIGCIYIVFITNRFLKRSVAVSSKNSESTILQTSVRWRSWIYIGAVFLLSTAVMDHVPVIGEVIPSIGNIFLCIYLFIVNEQIVHQRLFNFSALLNRIMLWFFISACVTLIYALFVAWVENQPALFILNSFIASFVILMLIDPFKTIINWIILRIFSRKYLEFENQVKLAEQALTGILDTNGLAQHALQFIENTLHCKSASFFVLRSDESKYRRIRGINDENMQNREIISSHAIIDFFVWMRSKQETPVILNHYLETEIQRTTSLEQREFLDSALQGLKALDANIAIPFLVERNAYENPILGFVALRADEPPEPWDDNWGALSAIYPYFERAASVLKNMEVYVRLLEKDRLASLGEMSAGLAHEIRNPLGAIKGAAQFLQQSQGSVSEDQKPFLNVIVDEVNRLNKVVTQFLDFARPISSNYAPTDISMLLQKIVDYFVSMQKDLATKVEIVLHEPQGGFSSIPKITISQEQIKQVLVNLVQNAYQAVQKNSGSDGRIVISADVIRTHLRNELMITIEDNGPGISRENIGKVFIPFFTTTQGGTGLGLPISARIIEAHGGRIDVQSNTDGGSVNVTRFSVYLPLKG